jgi:LmbE family N-acetylglucosaminyl deacetylase
MPSNRCPVLIVAPHPDDETLGCGGTFAKRVLEGCPVSVVVITDGRHLFSRSRWRIDKNPTPEETAAMRREETRRAVDILGGDGKSVKFLDVEDGSLSGLVEPVSEMLSEIIRCSAPGEIYVTSEHERHADHVAACAAVRAAMRKAGSRARLLRYAVSPRSPSDFPPTGEAVLAVDITDQLETKRRAINQFACHLRIVAEGQTEPVFKSIAPWLQPREVFLADAT